MEAVLFSISQRRLETVLIMNLGGWCALLNHQAGVPALRQPLKPGGLYDWHYTVERLRILPVERRW